MPFDKHDERAAKLLGSFWASARNCPGSEQPGKPLQDMIADAFRQDWEFHDMQMNSLRETLHVVTARYEAQRQTLERARNWIDTSMGKAKPAHVREIVSMLDAELDGAVKDGGANGTP